MSRRQHLLVLDTLGKLHAHGHGLRGYCRGCQRHFDVPLPALIAVRRADSPVVGMRPLTCAACGGRDTEIRITAPSRGGGRALEGRRPPPHIRQTMARDWLPSAQMPALPRAARLGTFIVLATLSMADPANGACSWTWDCSGGVFQCLQVPHCDSPLDVPPFWWRLVPAPTISPIAGPMVPPIGMLSCRPIYLCNNFGWCAWQTVCQ